MSNLVVKSVVTYATRFCLEIQRQKNSCHNCHKTFSIISTKLKSRCHSCHKIFFSILSKCLVTIATRPWEIFSGKAKNSLSQMPQDFFQASQNLLPQLPQAQLFSLWQLWQDMLRSLKFFWAEMKSHWHKCHKIFFKLFNIPCHNCHKPNCSSCGSCDKTCWGVWNFFGAAMKSHWHKCHKIFLKPLKTACHNCHKTEIFPSSDEKSLSQMPQDFFQRSQNRLSQLSQGQF